MTSAVCPGAPPYRLLLVCVYIFRKSKRSLLRVLPCECQGGLIKLVRHFIAHFKAGHIGACFHGNMREPTLVRRAMPMHDAQLHPSHVTQLQQFRLAALHLMDAHTADGDEDLPACMTVPVLAAARQSVCLSNALLFNLPFLLSVSVHQFRQRHVGIAVTGLGIFFANVHP